MRQIIFALLMLITLPVITYAANITSWDKNIFIEGLIIPGDEEKFRQILETSEIKITHVYMDSIGGELVDAINIGYMVMEHNISTVAVTKCYSACAYIWLAGENLLVHTFQYDELLYIRIHMPRNARNPDLVIPDWLLNLIKTYLEETGLNDQAVQEIMNTPSNSSLDIGPNKAAEWGIEVNYTPTSECRSGPCQ